MQRMTLKQLRAHRRRLAAEVDKAENNDTQAALAYAHHQSMANWDRYKAANDAAHAIYQRLLKVDRMIEQRQRRK
jgi:hypothetical protein